MRSLRVVHVPIPRMWKRVLSVCALGSEGAGNAEKFGRKLFLCRWGFCAGNGRGPGISTAIRHLPNWGGACHHTHTRISRQQPPHGSSTIAPPRLLRRSTPPAERHSSTSLCGSTWLAP